MTGDYIARKCPLSLLSRAMSLDVLLSWGNFPSKVIQNFIEEEEEMAISESFGHSARSVSFSGYCKIEVCKKYINLMG